MPSIASQWPRATALLALVLLSAVHLATLDISPTPWQDEVQIIDHGRNLIAPDPAWSLNWVALQRPVTLLNFVGPMLQETAYRWLAPSLAGPRLASLLGAIVASYLVFLWMRSRQLASGPALVIAAAFLLDPLFVQGYRGARLDSWTIGLVVAACLAVRHSRADAIEGRLSALLLLPGALMVSAFFVWPSAVYLAPLFIAEVCQVYLPLRLPLRQSVIWTLVALAGTLAALAFFLLIERDLIMTMLADRSFSTGPYYHPFTLASVPAAIRDAMRSYQQSPILPALAIFFALTGRNTFFAIAAGVAFLAALPTAIYVHRVVYFLPYIIAIVGDGWRHLEAEKPRRAWPAVVMAMVLSWAIGVSLIGRPTLALLAREARQPAVLLDAALQLPELRSQRVYLGPWEFYFAGRQLDWKMVKPYGGFAPEPERLMFEGLDYALVSREESNRRGAMFASMGWQVVHELTLPAAHAGFLWLSPSEPRQYYLYSRRPRAGDAPLR